MLESKYLKDNIENIQKLLGIPALRNFETKSLQKLLRLSKIREYEDGELIIEEGDLDPWLYFLLSGKIRITKEGLAINTIDKKGEIFGEMALIDLFPRSASVLAVRDCTAITLSTESVYHLYEKDLEQFALIQMNIGRELSRRLRIADVRLFSFKMGEPYSESENLPPLA